MSAPVIPGLPASPTRDMTQTQFDATNATWLAALGPWTTAANTSADFVNDKADEAAASAATALAAASGVGTDLIPLARRSAKEGPPAWVRDPSHYEVSFLDGEAWDPVHYRLVPLSSWFDVVTASGLCERRDGSTFTNQTGDFRLSDRGLRIDGASTNLLASPLAPAAQTITSLFGNGATSYVLTVLGSGSAAVSGSAAAGAARQGQPLLFTPAATGNLTVTVTGSLTSFSLDRVGALPAAGARAADSVKPSNELLAAMNASAGTILIELADVTLTSAHKAYLGGDTNNTVSLGTYSNHDKVNTSAGTYTSYDTGGGAIGSQSQVTLAAVAWSGSSFTIAANGGAVGTIASARPAISQIGAADGGGSFDALHGYVRWLSVQPNRLADADLPAATQLPRAFVTEDFSYPSSLDRSSYGHLLARVAYDPARRNAPLLVYLHGFGGSYTDIDDDGLRRWAARGFFVVSLQTRASTYKFGRDPYDVLDGVNAVRARYAKFLHPELNFLAGYSRGGGMALQCAMKMPALFAGMVACFPMSDDGYNSTYGWRYTNPAYQPAIDSEYGGDPATVPNKYHATYAIEGVPANLQCNRLLCFHDASDSIVDVSHSDRLNTAMSGNARFAYYRSTSSDSYRWLHNNPVTGDGGPVEIVRAEDIYMREFAKISAPGELPMTGSVRVHGFLWDRKFEIRLGNLDDHVATVAYNALTGSFTVTPLTGSVAVTINQGPLTITQTISSATTLTPV